MTRTIRAAAVTICLTALASGVWASGGNSMSRPSTEEPTRTPEQEALEHYNFGVAAREKGDKLQEKAAAAGNEKQRTKLTDKALKAYEDAIGEFHQAVARKPDFYQAYSDLGYCLRKTHDYDGSLQAYDQALQLEPGYAPAIEYRGEAYLGLNRIDDAKQAYMQLFGSDRTEADRLLEAMKRWVEVRKQEPDGVQADALESFAGWVSEREEIAGQTAALLSDGSRDW